MLGKWFGRTIIPHPPAYEEGAGLAYAKELASTSQSLSFSLTFIGWLLVMAGVSLAILGSVAGSKVATDPANLMDTLAAHPGLLCSVLAVVFGGAGWQVLDRANAATKVASVATVAIKQATLGDVDGGGDKSDAAAYGVCVAAKASWLEGRMNNERLESIVAQLGKK